MSKATYQPQGSRPIHVWTDEVEPSARIQLENMALLPFLHPHGMAVMPDVHAGIGSTVGTVIATHKAIIPAAVGVDIGCGMNAVRTSLTADDLPESLTQLLHDIERGIPLGAGGAHRDRTDLPLSLLRLDDVVSAANLIADTLYSGDIDKFLTRAASQLGTLGSGNHFIEVCLDEHNDVWIVLHSGSRGLGNMIGRHFIERAKRNMERYFITLPDADLAYFPETTHDFLDYMKAVDRIAEQ